jgi:hypothetical protein
MFFLLRWYKDYLEIKSDYKEKLKELDYCESCESLKLQLATVNEQNKYLLNKLTETPEPEKTPDTSNLKPLLPMHMSWSAKRQMLESESREEAKIRANKVREMSSPATATEKLTVEQIEKELGVDSAN